MFKKKKKMKNDSNNLAQFEWIIVSISILSSVSSLIMIIINLKQIFAPKKNLNLKIKSNLSKKALFLSLNTFITGISFTVQHLVKNKSQLFCKINSLIMGTTILGIKKKKKFWKKKFGKKKSKLKKITKKIKKN